MEGLSGFSLEGSENHMPLTGLCYEPMVRKMP